MVVASDFMTEKHPMNLLAIYSCSDLRSVKQFSNGYFIFVFEDRGKRYSNVQINQALTQHSENDSNEITSELRET